MENKSDGKASSKCLPTNIETLPARLQRKIIGSTDLDRKHSPRKEETASAHSPKLSAVPATGVLSSSNANISNAHLHANQSIHRRSEPGFINNTRCQLQMEYKSAKWLDLRTVNSKSEHLISCIETIKVVERELFVLLEERSFLEKWDTYCLIRMTLQKIFRKMLGEELKFCCKENVEQYFWKVLYYSSIEAMKKGGLFNSQYGGRACELIEEGLLFYEDLLELLRAEYHLNLDVFMGESYIKNGVSEKHSTHKNEILAKVSAQKILINLGDLSRYKEQIELTGSFKQAREYYEKAQQLLPTNGIPYNQLAVISIYSKKKLDAVYYHMRSLMASNPIHSAKESLKVLFDEIRKKQETSLPKENEVKSNESVMPMRREIWIHPDGSRRLHRFASFLNHNKKNSIDSEESLKQLDPHQLHKRFLLSFLHTQGKLFTGIGMDSFDQVTNQMLNEFKVLVFHSPCTFTYQRLLQIVSLNIFSVCYNNREGIKVEKREIRMQAFTVGTVMFAIILNKINDILGEYLFIECKESKQVLKLEAQPENNGIESLPCSPKRGSFKMNFPEYFFAMLSAVKVWCSWLLNYDDLRNSSLPYINTEKLRSINVDPWKSLAKFLNLMENRERCDDLLSQNTTSECMPVLLDEDIYLRGFAPLKLNDEDVVYCHKTCDYEETKNAFRLTKIFQFANILCSFENQIIRKVETDLNAAIYEGCLSFGTEKTTGDENTIDNQEDFEELIGPMCDLNKEFSEKALINDEKGNVEIGSKTDNPEISELIRRKNELEKKQKMQESYHQTLQGLLRKSGIFLHIEVRPKYLVPDTNCFIDFLDQLKVIASKSERFNLLVPLTVVSELEGLSKGIKEPVNMLASAEHENNPSIVTKRSKAALEFIRSKNNGIKCVTTKGSILNSSVFTLEESENQISNDDKILMTAIHLCKHNIDRYEDGIHYIETEVVLLTKDRNLRVKALARNLSVSHLSGFLKWAGHTR